MDLQKSDTRRRQIQLLDSAIGDPGRLRNKPKGSLADCNSLFQVLKEEYRDGTGTLVHRLYHDAFQICITHGDEARVSVFAERGV